MTMISKCKLQAWWDPVIQMRLGALLHLFVLLSTLLVYSQASSFCWTAQVCFPLQLAVSVIRDLFATNFPIQV
jgi:hypothetical protein